MRTTLTIDDVLYRDLKELAHKTRTPLKRVIDRVLRSGVRHLDRRPAKEPLRVRTFAMGDVSGVNLDKALGLASALEDEERTRKLALRK